MADLSNILLFEHSPEALEAVRSGDAIISAGGIRRKGKAGSGFLEQAKPAQMSVADFQDLFEGKEHALETDQQIRLLDKKIALSVEGQKELQTISWLNHEAIQRVYSLTYNGFKQTLNGIENITRQLYGFEEYVKNRDAKMLLEKSQVSMNYLKTDAGDLRLENIPVINGRSSEHLDQISAFINSLLSEISDDRFDSFLHVQILINLIAPFSYVVRRFSALYYYESGSKYMPGNYEEWIRTISSVANSEIFKDKIEYYIKLKTPLCFRDKMILCKDKKSEFLTICRNLQFERKYIQSHNKDNYLYLGSQIINKIENGDYHIQGRNAAIFLE